MALHNAGWLSPESLQFYSVAAGVNIVLYALIGALIWWGLHKHRIVLYIVALIIPFGWYKLLTS